MAAPSAANPSSSQQSFHGGKQSTQKQSRAARERATAGPSRGMLLLHIPFLVIDQAVVSSPQQSAGGGAKWEEPDLPDIPKPHGLFGAAWKKADKSSKRVRSGQVDPGYRFPKPTLFVNVSTLERKKTYLLNWLSASALWMSQVDVRSPSKFPSPQMWRDFLNTIDTNQLSSTRSGSMKSAVLDILGEIIVQAAQGLTVAPAEIVWRGIQVSSFVIF